LKTNADKNRADRRSGRARRLARALTSGAATNEEGHQMRRDLCLAFVVSCGLMGAVVACGGSVATDDNGGGDQDATTGHDSGGSPAYDGSSGTDTGGGGSDTGTGGGDSGTVGDSATGSNPHKVPCGSVSCDTNTGNSCCIHITGPLHGDAVCGPGGPCQGGFEEQCDETADCDGGSICCFEGGGSGGIQAQSFCQTPTDGGTCGFGGLFGGIQLCRTQAECANGCHVHNCFNQQVEACSQADGGPPIGCQ
jgi:hypothetical protein